MWALSHFHSLCFPIYCVSLSKRRAASSPSLHSCCLLPFCNVSLLLSIRDDCSLVHSVVQNTVYTYCRRVRGECYRREKKTSFGSSYTPWDFTPESIGT
ncbi:hypothetical protein ACS0TY_001347 [Phlomoides rotata]